MQEFDLIIVGGGLVGAALSLALQATHLRIAVIEAKLPSSDDPRLFALNESSCQFLKNLNVWEALSSHATPIHEVHASYQGRFGIVRLQRETVNLESLGHVIPAYVIESLLSKELLALTQKAHYTLFRPAILKTLQQDAGIATLTIQSEGKEINLSAPLVIGADGTQSTVRQALKISTDTLDYEQDAIVTRTTLNRSHAHIAYERFTQHGAIAMLPLGENECATIWTATIKEAHALMALSDADFLQALQKNFGYRLGRLKQIKQRFQFPLRKVTAKTPALGCVFLLGNAAHTLSPIAAQGFNVALYEVAVLAESLLNMPTGGNYSQALQSANEKIASQVANSAGLSHRLTGLFSGDSKLKQFALQAGLLGFELSLPLKKQFISKILGKTTTVPRLLLSTS